MKSLLVAILSLFCLGFGTVQAEEKWKGIDEAVIEKYAQERGRPASEPLLNVEGDLLLFLFALAGAAGGFVVGYYWHKVFVAGKKDRDKGE